MKRLLLILTLLLAATTTIQAQVGKYDLNEDGSVNVGDVTTLVNAILGKGGEGADLNDDGSVNVGDVTTLVNYILGKIPTEDDAVELTATSGDRYTDGILVFSVTDVEKQEVSVVGVVSEYKDKLGDVLIHKKVKIDGEIYVVTSIGDGTFYYCSGLTSVNIPNSVTTIGTDAFFGCTGLTSVNIPSSVTSIGVSAFYGCSGLTSVTIPNSVTSIGSGAFMGCKGLTSVNIPNSVTTIGGSAFEGCTGLTSVTIPNSVTSIGSSAFADCTALKRVTINSDEVLSEKGLLFRTFDFETERFTFNHAYGTRFPISMIFGVQVEEYILGNMVKSIGEQAFIFCTGLKSITIPESVTTIGDAAFCGCIGLTSVNIPSSVTTIGYHAFSGCASLTSIKVEAGNTKYDSRDNCNAIIETASNTLIAGCDATTIPSSVTTIGGDAFRGCIGLKSITIPSSVTEIGSYAFSGCTGLTSITIPSSVTTIGYYAFRGCTGLTSVTALRTDPLAYKCDFSAFDRVPISTCTLHVPAGRIDAYKSRSPWSNFGTIIDDAPTE